MDEVILVDERDIEVGSMEKLEAHKKGLLHRALSVFIFTSTGLLLLQKRSDTKYHSAGLWSNTCCSHPRPNEDVKDAASRRLSEEMGLESNIWPAFTFSYRVEFDNGLIENELDHIFVGIENNNPSPNIDEVQQWKLVDMNSVIKDIEEHPSNYTFWFRKLLPKVQEYISRNPI